MNVCRSAIVSFASTDHHPDPIQKDLALLAAGVAGIWPAPLMNVAVLSVVLSLSSLHRHTQHPPSYKVCALQWIPSQGLSRPHVPGP